MKKRTRRAIVSAVVALGLLGGTATWWIVRPEAPAPVSGDQRYEDIPRSEYEQWMQDLGYTD